MISRQIQDVLIELNNSFPIVTITGPRQSGKTTLAKLTFPDKEYVSLEDLDTRSFAETDPRGFLTEYSEGAIFDEVQRVPSLLSYLQTFIDEDGKNGKFILTGSNHFEYFQSISQSLAGRTGILKLLPLSYREIYGEEKIEANDVLYNGFYPRIFKQNIKPAHFLSAYVQTYVQRDVRTLLNIKNLTQFHQFLKLCAGRTGQIINATSMGNDLGVTNKTVMQWLSVLEASFLVFFLPPFHKNFNKRIIKSPKLYFQDVGLACHLLGIENSRQLQTHPLKGELFETFIVGEFLKQRYNQGKESNLYYFRDNTGNEVDLILETGSGLTPVEIKSGKTVNRQFFKGLDYFKKLSGEVERSVLVTGGDIKRKQQGHHVFGYSDIKWTLFDS